MSKIICENCKGKTFVEAKDFINLRPANKKMKMGSEKVYIVCKNCGEVASIRAENPEKL